MSSLDERATEELRSEIKRRELLIRSLLHEDKDAPPIASEDDLPEIRELQKLAIHTMKMLEAAAVQLISGDRQGCMNSILSGHHGARIVIGDG
jgi:hypothetical protein